MARMREMPRLGPADAAIFETFVVPRYLALFGALAIDMVAETEDAQVSHVRCRTGYPDRGLLQKLPGAYVFGCDPSPSAVALAQAKAQATPDMVSEYVVCESLPTPYPSSAFSHALSLDARADPEDRSLVLDELARLLAPHGQALLATPLRGSFQELGDLLREYALKREAPDLAKGVDASDGLRPTEAQLGEELAAAGFEFIEVASRTEVLRFQSGRDFVEDPVTRLVLLPELRLHLGDAGLGAAGLDAAIAYVRDAIDKYWSDGEFELTVTVGCGSGRRAPR